MQKWRKEWSSKENKGKLQQKHDTSTGAVAVGKKGTSPDEATLISEKIKPVAIAIIKLHLSKGIRKLVSQSVSQSVENSAR